MTSVQYHAMTHSLRPACKFGEVRRDLYEDNATEDEEIRYCLHMQKTHGEKMSTCPRLQQDKLETRQSRGKEIDAGGVLRANVADRRRQNLDGNLRPNLPKQVLSRHQEGCESESLA